MFRKVKKPIKENKEDFDYKTSSVDLSEGDVIDTSKTGFSYYDDYLTKSGQDYLFKKTGTVGKIVNMSPREYYVECGTKIFENSSPSRLKATRTSDSETIEYLHDVLTQQGKKFPLPYINYADKQQEGLHRMMVIGDMLGWDYKVPVLVVDYADGEKDKREKEKQDLQTAKEIDGAVSKALDYRYDNITDIEDEIAYQFEDNNFSVDYHEDTFDVTRNGVTREFFIDSIKVNNKSYPYDSDNLIDYLDWSDILSGADIDKMSPEEFDKYLKDLSKK